MKKIGLSMLVLACLSSAAFAEKSVSLKAGSATILEESVPMGFLSFGFTKTFSNNFYGGLIYNFGYGAIDQEEAESSSSSSSSGSSSSSSAVAETAAVGAFGMDLRLGYTVDKFDIFGLIGGEIQSIDGVSAAGFTYGAGVDWKFADNFSVGVEYKQGSMELEANLDYDYDLASANISYRW